MTGGADLNCGVRTGQTANPCAGATRSALSGSEPMPCHAPHPACRALGAHRAHRSPHGWSHGLGWPQTREHVMSRTTYGMTCAVGCVQGAAEATYTFFHGDRGILRFARVGGLLGASWGLRGDLPCGHLGPFGASWVLGGLRRPVCRPLNCRCCAVCLSACLSSLI